MDITKNGTVMNLIEFKKLFDQAYEALQQDEGTHKIEPSITFYLGDKALKLVKDECLGIHVKRLTCMCAHGIKMEFEEEE